MIILYIILAILVLELLIFVHELGHFAAGKLLGFRVLGFSLGFGPALFKFTKGETEYALRAIPFGGACQFDGEDEDAESDPRRFNANPVWKRFIVILAGPFMNVLTAFLIMFVANLATPKPVYAVDAQTGSNIAVIAEVYQGTPAANAGIEPNDVLVAINGETPSVPEGATILDAFISAIASAGDDFTVTVKRNGVEQLVDVTGAYDKAKGRSVIGITMSMLIDGYAPRGLASSVTDAGDYLVLIVRETAKGIGGMFTNGLSEVSGVVGTVGIMATEAQKNTVSIVYIAVILSLSLGVFNLIPFPALDGGRLLFLIVEAIIRRPLNRKVEAIVNGVGLALLFGLMIVITVKDVLSFLK